MKHVSKVLFWALILCTACLPDDDLTDSNNDNQNFSPTDFSQNFGANITRTFIGNVVNTNNEPIENALIKIGGATATTDYNGVFVIKDATVQERFGYITAEKSGFIDASRAVVPSEGTNSVTIMMLRRTFVGSTSSGSQETISLANGASVSLEGDYIREDGTNYSGNVGVVLHHLNPADEHMQDQMPGMLYAANAQNEEVTLRTFGMLAVELIGDSGEELNLAEGSSAEIRVPLDPSLLADAPATIPLWYFDEINGYWVEEGQAVLTGTEYVGTVTHFSFWNCDVSNDAVSICITLIDEEGKPLSNAMVSLITTTFGTSQGITNEDGTACGFIPSNEVLEISVFGIDDCASNSIYFDTIGPFFSDQDLTITVPDSNEITNEEITGIFQNCNGQPVTNGYVQIRYLNQNYLSYVDNGSFEFNFIRCIEMLDFTIQAYDITSLQQTNIQNFTLTSPQTQIGTISSCIDSSEFLSFTVDNDSGEFYNSNLFGNQRPYILVPNDDSSIVPALDISRELNSSVNLASFQIFGFLDETQLENQYSWGIDLENGSPGLKIITNSTVDLPISDVDNNIIFDVSNIGAVGEFIDLSFQGTFQDFEGETHFIEGFAHVIRDE